MLWFLFANIFCILIVALDNHIIYYRVNKKKNTDRASDKNSEPSAENVGNLLKYLEQNPDFKNQLLLGLFSQNNTKCCLMYSFVLLFMLAKC